MKIRAKSTHDYAAEMTFNRFDAISRYMSYFDLVAELKAGKPNYNKQDSEDTFLKVIDDFDKIQDSNFVINRMKDFI